MLKVGIVGIGGICGAHIPVWEAMEEAELVALCDKRPETLEKYPDKHLYTDFEEMLDAEQLDILDICLPTHLHADFAIRAMDRGIHVICEKPISLKKEDVGRIYDAAGRNQVCFMVAHVLRFWPEYMLLKEVCDSGKYGKLLSGTMRRLSGIPKWSVDGWMQDEGRSGLVPFDLHIHDLDFLVYTFGAPADTKVHRVKRPEQDYFSVVYEYPDFFVTVEAAWYAAPYPFTAGYRFQFEKAILVFGNGQCVLYEDNGAVTNFTTAGEGDTGSINLPKSDAFANEIRYFTDCVLKNEFPDRVKPEELCRVIEILKSL